MAGNSKLGQVAVDESATNGHQVDLLSLDDILAADDTVYEYVSVPEWGGRVRVVSLTGADRSRVFAAIRAYGKQIKDDDEASTQFYARVIAASLVDDQGEHIAKQSDVPKLIAKSGAALTRVWLVCRRLSGLSDEDVQQAKDDLKATPSDASGGE